MIPFELSRETLFFRIPDQFRSALVANALENCATNKFCITLELKKYLM